MEFLPRQRHSLSNLFSWSPTVVGEIFQILQNLFIIYLFDLFRFVEFLPRQRHSLSNLFSWSPTVVGEIFQILQNLFIIYLFDLFRFVEFLLEEHSLQKLYFIDFVSQGITFIPLTVETVWTEVDEHSVRQMSEVHVVPQLAAVLGIDMADGLQLNDDVVVDDQVHAVGLVKLNVVPVNGQEHLAFYFVTLLLQHVLQGCFVGALQQSAVVLAMHAHGLARNVLEELVPFVILTNCVHKNFLFLFDLSPTVVGEIIQILSNLSNIIYIFCSICFDL